MELNLAQFEGSIPLPSAQPSGYWWECDRCHDWQEFNGEVGKDLVTFIGDNLSVDWDQEKLVRPCNRCREGQRRITYFCPRKRSEVSDKLKVIHMFGLTPNPNDGYLPMLWETALATEPNSGSQVHFNYIYYRSSWGLNKAAVLAIGELQALLDLYAKKTSKKLVH